MILRRRRADWRDEPRGSADDLRHAARRAAVQMAASTLAAHDGVTGNHSDDVVTLCGALADRFGFSEERRSLVLATAQLHDIGKLEVPQGILGKPGPLDPSEWEMMRGHTVAGQRMLGSVPELADVARLVRHSHERWDGGGYPDGLAGEEIPFESRIVFCADAFHAIRCDRPYRPGRSAEEALEEVRRNAGSQFDPQVVAALETTVESLRRSPGRRAAAMTEGVGSRRLVALLLALVVGGGSAVAAPGSPVRDLLGGGGEEPAEASQCEPPCLPAPFATLGALPKAGEARAPGRPALGAAAARGGRAAGERAAHAGRAGNGDARARPSSARRAPGPLPGPVGAAPSSPPQPSFAPPRAVPPRGVTPRKDRPPRSLAPGRSGEAPRRPADPGRPTGPAPGRSGEAPGKPLGGPGKFGHR